MTSWIQNRANTLLVASNAGVKRVPIAQALKAATTHQVDFVTPYVADLTNVIDMEAIRASGLKLGVDPLGGAAGHYWEPIADLYGLDITVTNPAVDPTFRFMTLDHDGQIRMDCSSPYAMASLVNLKDRFDVAFANDPDSDRHGIVTRSAGLMNPDHYLAVAINYLLTHRPNWPAQAAVGKTLVSSSIIDRVAKGLGRTLAEVPVGFKWFVEGLFTGTYCFGGEESAGASFLRRDGTVWTTDGTGPSWPCSAEITAKTGKDRRRYIRNLTAVYGDPLLGSTHRPRPSRRRVAELSPEAVRPPMAGEPITAKLTRAPASDTDRRIKVVTASSWFAAPQGRRRHKISRRASDRAHLDTIVTEAPSLPKAINHSSVTATPRQHHLRRPRG